MGDAQRLRVGWTEQQWGAIDAAVASEVMRVRVVEQVIPTTKVGANDKTVAIDRINSLTGNINDVTTIPANLAGVPAMSIPCGLDDAGLPIGVQLTASALDETTLLRVGDTLEADLGLDLRPPLLAGI